MLGIINGGRLAYKVVYEPVVNGNINNDTEEEGGVGDYGHDYDYDYDNLGLLVDSLRVLRVARREVQAEGKAKAKAKAKAKVNAKAKEMAKAAGGGDTAASTPSPNSNSNSNSNVVDGDYSRIGRAVAGRVLDVLTDTERSERMNYNYTQRHIRAVAEYVGATCGKGGVENKKLRGRVRELRRGERRRLALGGIGLGEGNTVNAEEARGKLKESQKEVLKAVMDQMKRQQVLLQKQIADNAATSSTTTQNNYSSSSSNTHENENNDPFNPQSSSASTPSFKRKYPLSPKGKQTPAPKSAGTVEQLARFQSSVRTESRGEATMNEANRLLNTLYLGTTTGVGVGETALRAVRLMVALSVEPLCKDKFDVVTQAGRVLGLAVGRGERGEIRSRVKMAVKEARKKLLSTREDYESLTGNKRSTKNRNNNLGVVWGGGRFGGAFLSFFEGTLLEVVGEVEREKEKKKERER